MSVGNTIVYSIIAIAVPLGLFLLYREAKFLGDSEILSGKVINLRSKSGSKGGIQYAPDIEIRMKDGSTHMYYHDVYSKPSAFDVGELIPMGYDGFHFRLMHFMNRFGAPFFLFAIGLSLIFYISARFYFENIVANKIISQNQLPE